MLMRTTGKTCKTGSSISLSRYVESFAFAVANGPLQDEQATLPEVAITVNVSDATRDGKDVTFKLHTKARFRLFFTYC